MQHLLEVRSLTNAIESKNKDSNQGKNMDKEI